MPPFVPSLYVRRSGRTQRHIIRILSEATGPLGVADIRDHFPGYCWPTKDAVSMALLRLTRRGIVISHESAGVQLYALMKVYLPYTLD